MNIEVLANDLCTVLGVAVGALAALRFVHILQLESYQAKMYAKWVKRHALRDYVPLILVFIICMLLEASLPFAAEALNLPANSSLIAFAMLGVRIIYIVLMLYISFAWSKLPVKKALVYTGRVKRLICALVLVLALVNIYPYLLPAGNGSIADQLFLRASAYLPALLLPVLVLLAHYVTYPIEQSIKRWYYMDAKRKLSARTDVIRIGVTGSFGKTSTKFALGEMLKEKFDVCVPPGSFNTPMGITRVIREQLSEKNEVLIAEMGARYVGDIEELCDLVSPTIGMLTSVGAQHLETFKSLENIANTKFELIASLPADGAAFFNADNETCAELFKRQVAVENKYLYGIDAKGELYMRAIAIKSTAQGSKFTLLHRSGETIECRTNLLGKHNILNIVGCAAVCRYMGLSMEQIASGILRLEAVDHRLKLMPSNNSVTVIDDAFNSNPVGSDAALEVLRSFDGRKLIITPGMVELGDKEWEYNEQFGHNIAQSVDFAVLIGKKRSAPIKKGMLAQNFPEENIFVVESLDKATAVLAHLSRPGDVVLFENDLPDNYDE